LVSSGRHYIALVAALFAGPGIWLGLTLTREKPEVIVREVPAQAPEQDTFAVDAAPGKHKCKTAG
jgi:hypothetical protein